jgi:hypothetical protein
MPHTSPATKRILSIHCETFPDLDPDTSYLEQEEFQVKREQYEANLFGYIGIRAMAELQLSAGGPIQRITSRGLWGIEDDSNAEYLDSIRTAEMVELRMDLMRLGFSTRAIDEAVQEAGQQ